MFGPTTFAGGPFAQYGSKRQNVPLPNSYALLMDWNGAGDFANSYSNVTTYLIDVQCDRGRNVYSPLMGRANPGKLTAILDNSAGYFSSLNTQSPLYGKVVPSRLVQFRTVYGTRWTGYINSVTPDRQGARPVVKIEAQGAFQQFNYKKVNPPADAGSLTGTIIGEILDAAGWSSAARSIEAGQSTTSRWYEANIDAMTALRRIEETELGFLYEDHSGLVVFEDRAHRRTGARLVSQVTYSDAPGATYPYIGITQQDPLPYIVNEVIATVTPYTVQNSPNPYAVLWTLADTPSIAPGQTLTWYANYPSPNGPTIQTVGGANLQGTYVDAWTTPVSGTDYTVSGVALGDLAVTVVKSATTMKISIKNNHVSNTASITLLQARGNPVTKGSSTSVTSIDATSQAAYGLRSYKLPAQWLQNTSQAQSYADSIIASHKDPRPLLELKFAFPAMTGDLQMGTIRLELMGRKISDRVTVIAGQTLNPLGISADFFVEYIKDHYDVQKNRYEVTLGLSQVGAESTAGGWTLGTSALDSTTILSF